MITDTLRYINNTFDLESKAKMLYFLAIHKKHDFETADFIAKAMAFENDMELENWFETFNVHFSFSAIKKKSLYEIVETIIAKLLPNTKAEETNIEARHSAYVHYFLDLVLEKDTRNQSGLADFLDYWDKNKHKLSVPSPEGANAVRIMTIHKSKGLEFPVVIMPFADENYSKKPPEKMWLDTHDDNVALEKVLIDKVKDVTSYNEDSKLIYNQKEQEALLDNINVLYVALTRAKEQLHIVSSKIKPNKDGDYPNTMARFFVDYLIDKGVFNENQEVYTFGNPEKVSEKSNFQATANIIENVSDIFDPKNIKIATKEALMWGTHQQEAIAFGNILHEILATINTKDDINFALNNAIEQGLIHENQRGITLQKIEAVVHHELLQDYFSNENQIFNEQTIVSNAITLKPDKMVLDKYNNMYLLDYKTGMALQKHQVQIEDYEAVITTTGYKVTKKALVYIGETINVSVL
jgi:ATP-dependent exoDNAse (exonuclease V) beta subunit